MRAVHFETGLTRAAAATAAATVVATAVTLAAVAFALMVLNRETIAVSHFGSTTAESIAILGYLTAALVGATIVSKRPRHPVGWILSVSALMLLFVGFAAEYALYAVLTAPGSLPAAATVAWVGGWAWEAGAGFGLTFSMLLFPNGRLPSPRWRPVALLGALSIFLVVAVTALAPGRLDLEFSIVTNPYGAPWEVLRSVREWVWIGFAVNLVLVTASLVVRLRTAKRHEVQQIKMLLYAMSLAIVAVPLFELTYVEGQGSPWLVQAATGAALVAVPGAFGIALLKYRLFDIDLVISRTVVYGGLAAFITGVYVLLVGVLGSLLGAKTGTDNLLSLLAVGLVAVAFQPVRERLTTLADRVVYGVRATPYQVLSSFSRQLSQTVATDETLVRTARLFAEAIGAERAHVWLRPATVGTSAARPSPSPIPSTAPRLPSRDSLSPPIPVPVQQGTHRQGWAQRTASHGAPAGATLAARRDSSVGRAIHS